MRDANSSQRHKNWISGQRDGYAIRLKLSSRIARYCCLGLRSSFRRGSDGRAMCRIWAAWCLAVLEPCLLLHSLKAKLIFSTSMFMKSFMSGVDSLDRKEKKAFCLASFLCGADEMKFPSSCPGLHRACLRAHTVEASCIGQSERDFG